MMTQPVLEQPTGISQCETNDLERLKQSLRVAQRKGLVQPSMDPALDGADTEDDA
jgi:predicted transcriptional regulator